MARGVTDEVREFGVRPLKIEGLKLLDRPSANEFPHRAGRAQCAVIVKGITEPSVTKAAYYSNSAKCC